MGLEGVVVGLADGTIRTLVIELTDCWTDIPVPTKDLAL